MAQGPPQGSAPSPGGEELRYARVLAWCTRAGMGVLLVTLILYLAGAVPPLVPLEETPAYWSLSIDDYQEESGMREQWGPVKGWRWVRHVDHGEFLVYVGIAMLAAVTIGCYLAILPMLLRKGRRLYAVMVILELLVLGLAASGVVGV